MSMINSFFLNIALILLFTLAILKPLFSQKIIGKYNHRSEIYFTGRLDKNYFDFFPSIGYDFSLNKRKVFVSINTEFIMPLSKSTNFGNSLMYLLKLNRQKEHITSLAIGKKYDFQSKQNNWVGLAEYKYDIYKYKLTFALNILVQRTISIQSSVAGTCTTGNCRINPYYLWYFGFSTGKYF